MDVPIAEIEVERRVAAFVEALRADGQRVTRQRLEVAREIARTSTHPDVETVYENVRARIPTISLDTVYRTLATLERRGFVRRMEAVTGPTRYDPNLERHDHFICTNCGLIRDIYGNYQECVRVPESVPDVGRVESVTVQLRGLCSQCQGPPASEAESEKGVGE